MVPYGPLRSRTGALGINTHYRTGRVSSLDVVPAELPPDLRAAVRAFEDAGAVSAATARPLAEMPGLEPTAAVGLAARHRARGGPRALLPIRRDGGRAATAPGHSRGGPPRARVTAADRPTTHPVSGRAHVPLPPN